MLVLQGLALLGLLGLLGLLRLRELEGVHRQQAAAREVGWRPCCSC